MKKQKFKEQKELKEGQWLFHLGRSFWSSWHIGKWMQRFLPKGTHANEFRWDCVLPGVSVSPQQYNDDGTFTIPWWKPQETVCGGYLIKGYQISLHWHLIGAGWTLAVGVVKNSLYACMDDFADESDRPIEPQEAFALSQPDDPAEFDYEIPEEFMQLEQEFPAIQEQQYSRCTQCVHDDGSTPDEWGCQLECVQRLALLYKEAMGGTDYGIAQYCPHFQKLAALSPVGGAVNSEDEDQWLEARALELDYPDY